MGESIEVVDEPPTVGEQLPSVTFLCTAYRTERTVAGTIESVLRQTRSDWQLVVVDNGMSDEIAAIVGAYTDDPRISLVRQENQKLPGGVNAAGRQAHGRYLSVLNSDDEVEPTFVDRLAGFLDASPETAAVACDARFMADDGRALAQTHMGVNASRPERHAVTLAELVDGFVPYYTAAVRRTRGEPSGACGPTRPSSRISLCGSTSSPPVIPFTCYRTSWRSTDTRRTRTPGREGRGDHRGVAGTRDH